MMGDMADYYDPDYEHRGGGFTVPQEPRIHADFQQKKVWVQHDGTPIAIKDMTTGHLENTVAMLRRAAPGIYDREVIHYFLTASEPGGDMAMDLFDHEFDRAIEREPWDWLKSTPLVKAMRKELERRREVA